MPTASYAGFEDSGRYSSIDVRRLVIRPGAIGDVIVSLPALEWLRTDYTEIWVPENVMPLIRFADRVRSIGSTGLDLVEFQQIRFEPFDEVWSWYGGSRPAFREAVAHLPFRFFPALPPGGTSTHATDFYCTQVGAPLRATPHIECARGEGGFLAIQPFSGSPGKNWPLECFEQVAKRAGIPVQWTAGPEEALRSAARFDDLFELAQWLAGASVYLGNDSGITHLAAAVGTPVIAIFRATNPEVWAPRGPSVTVVQDDPKPDEILHLLERLLAGDSPPER